MKKINLDEKFTLFSEHWTPKVIGELNGQQMKLAKVKGDFVWHDHEEEDELFIVFKGTLYMDFRDGRTEVIHRGSSPREDTDGIGMDIRRTVHG